MHRFGRWKGEGHRAEKRSVSALRSALVYLGWELKSAIGNEGVVQNRDRRAATRSDSKSGLDLMLKTIHSARKSQSSPPPNLLANRMEGLLGSMFASRGKAAVPVSRPGSPSVGQRRRNRNVFPLDPKNALEWFPWVCVWRGRPRRSRFRRAGSIGEADRFRKERVCVGGLLVGKKNP